MVYGSARIVEQLKILKRGSKKLDQLFWRKKGRSTVFFNTWNENITEKWHWMPGWMDDSLIDSIPRSLNTGTEGRNVLLSRCIPKSSSDVHQSKKARNRK